MRTLLLYANYVKITNLFHIMQLLPLLTNLKALLTNASRIYLTISSKNLINHKQINVSKP